MYAGPPTIGQLANLKRLYFEATTLVIASLKQSVANETGDQQVTLKMLPIAEKRTRAETQAGRLSGLSLVGELEPSHHLVNLATHILETGSIIWIAPSKCSKRDDEIQVAIKAHTGSIHHRKFEVTLVLSLSCNGAGRDVVLLLTVVDFCRGQCMRSGSARC